MNRHRQQGVTTVEIAAMGTVTMVVLFSVFEVARAFFVLNALEEATRRGARMAVVCPIDDPAIAQTTVFAPSGGGPSRLVPGMNTGNVVVEYLDQNGAVIADPAASFSQIFFVRVRLLDVEHQLLIPLFLRTYTAPPFATTLPAESLGIPRVGAITAC